MWIMLESVIKSLNSWNFYMKVSKSLKKEKISFVSDFLKIQPPSSSKHHNYPWLPNYSLLKQIIMKDLSQVNYNISQGIWLTLNGSNTNAGDYLFSLLEWRTHLQLTLKNKWEDIF